MNKNVLLACASVWSIAAPPVSAEPLVRVHTSYYYVDGPSATVLAAQIEQNGPPGADGKRYAGKTKWDVQWKFKHEQSGVTCEMKEVAVAVGVAQTLPRWRSEKKGVAALKTRWQQFSDALKRHEDATRITVSPPAGKLKPRCLPRSRPVTARTLPRAQNPRPMLS